jgi:protein gp37
VQCHESRLDIPLHWKEPQVVFVDSMSDLFHEDVPYQFIAKVFAICRIAENHIFIILTKRQNRMIDLLWSPIFWNEVDSQIEQFAENGPSANKLIKNIWLGVSIENQAAADERIPLLLSTPAAKRIVSVEPMLEKIDIFKYLLKISWVICGRETGASARPFDPAWVLDLKEQCDIAGMPFWWKNHPEFQARPA